MQIYGRCASQGRRPPRLEPQRIVSAAITVISLMRPSFCLQRLRCRTRAKQILPEHLEQIQSPSKYQMERDASNCSALAPSVALFAQRRAVRGRVPSRELDTFTRKRKLRSRSDSCAQLRCELMRILLGPFGHDHI